MSDPAKQWNYLVGSALEAARDGNLDDAEARVRRALALDPAPTVSDRELGEVWMQLGVVLTRKKSISLEGVTVAFSGLSRSSIRSAALHCSMHNNALGL